MVLRSSGEVFKAVRMPIRADCLPLKSAGVRPSGRVTSAIASAITCAWALVIDFPDAAAPRDCARFWLLMLLEGKSPVLPDSRSDFIESGDARPSEKVDSNFSASSFRSEAGSDFCVVGPFWPLGLFDFVLGLVWLGVWPAAGPP